MPRRELRIEPQWLASNPSKRNTEIFFLIWSACWVLIFGAVVVSQVYFTFGDIEYLILGFILSVPYFLIPFLFPSQVDKTLSFHERYYVKANIWIAIFSYVGNYFWTHYFYKVLGASYSFPVKIMLNEVPLFLYFVTHAYFSLYLTGSTIIIRRFRTSKFSSFFGSCLLISFLSLFTAFMETYTISGVPYYSHTNKELMYTVGSVFYGIYFYVGFPMFYNIDEKVHERPWTLTQTAKDALAASMIVFILLDLWRISFPSIISNTQHFDRIWINLESI